MSDNVYDSERQDLIQAAYALLMAAVLLRDLASAMPRATLESMPMDIRARMFAPYYQEAFDSLPADIKAHAERLVRNDPDVIRAREIDSQGRR